MSKEPVPPRNYGERLPKRFRAFDKNGVECWFDTASDQKFALTLGYKLEAPDGQDDSKGLRVGVPHDQQ